MEDKRIGLLQAKIDQLELVKFEKTAELKGYIKIQEKMADDPFTQKAMKSNIELCQRTVDQQEIMLSSYKEDLAKIKKEV